MTVTTQPYSNFQWLPWIGDNYLDSNKKLLIVGESHYDSEEREGDLEDRECIRWFVGGVGVNSPNNPQRFIRNVERALFASNPTNEQKGQFWHSVAYHVLVQRILESIDERPTNEDYVNGWENFFKLVKELKPEYCLFCGVEAASFNGAFIEAACRNNYEAENIAHGDKVGKVAIRTTIISDACGYQSKLIFMKHPSRSFSWKKWSELLRETMPEYIKSLLN